MNRDDVLRMAVEAGCGWAHNGTEPLLVGPHIERFAALVADAARGDYHEGWEEGYKAGVIAEREECAKVCEQYDDDGGTGEVWGPRFAAAIRARGES